MSRNFYILAATLLFFSLVSFGLMWMNAHPGPSLDAAATGDAPLWKTIGLVMMLFALLAALIGTIFGLYEQTSRRFDENQTRHKK